jgi:glycosyltransferase involved in cell wall biosynthesis
MKVLYDHQTFFNQDYGGISRYFFELMNQYNSTNVCEFELSALFSNNDYLLSSNFFRPISLFKDNKFARKSKFYKVFNKFDKLNSRLRLNLGNFDVFHPTSFDPYFLNSLHKKPFVLTVHDMAHEAYPELFSANDKTSKDKQLLSNKADRIIAVSNSTKKELIKFFGVDKDKIDVVYHGNSIVRPNQDISVEGLPNNYLLFIGQRIGYRNFLFSIKALKDILIQNNLYFVCAGGPEFNEEEKRVINECGLTSRVMHFSVSDKTLYFFYKNAKMLLFPSFYEGFGIPILEAFSVGCPVVLSKTTSFPEIALDAGEYFLPHKEDSMQKAVLNILTKKKHADKLIKNGLKRSKYFSWTKCAHETLEVYKKVV